MLEGSHIQYHPQFSNGGIKNMIRAGIGAGMPIEQDYTKDELLTNINKSSKVHLRKLKSKSGKVYKSTKSPKNLKKSKKKSSPTPSPTPPKDEEHDPPLPCDPVDVRLLDYPQWQAEKGYVIGEYTFLQGNGDAFESSTWNYPYDHYKGFITGEVSG